MRESWDFGRHLDVSLPVKKYQLLFRTEKNFRISEYSTSAWRGGLGYALKGFACRTPSENNCSVCPYRFDCKFTRLFELGALGIEAPPVPYILYSPQGATSLTKGMAHDLGLTLIGGAIADEKMIIDGLAVAASHGIGPDRGSFKLAAVNALSVSPWEGMTDKFEISFLSPMRFRHHGKYIGPDQFNFLPWLQSLMWRITSLCKAYGHISEFDVEQVLQAASCLEVTESDLFWRDVSRSSSRQQSRMKLGGILGSFTIEGDMGLIWPWLEMGSLLHAGKSTSMGYGAFGVKSL